MKILALGITGSIGSSLLKVLDKHELVGCSFYKNQEKAKQIIDQYNIKFYYSPLHSSYSNVEDLDDLIQKSKPDLIVNAVTGYEGLSYTLTCIKYKIDLALANKESLVMAGKFINEIIKEKEINLYPIDSEHSSLYEMFHHCNVNDIKTLIITCSGGSCYHLTKKELNNLKFNDVINHPNWNMGWKISMDSATLINKCFEIVEAYHLFNFKNIKAIYHPQSIIHSMIEFNDRSIWTNMSTPDMAISVDLAINRFKKQSPKIKPLSFYDLKLSFGEIDVNKWKPIKWAYEIINDKNNSLGIIINVANQKAIDLFKKGLIKFTDIYSYIQKHIDQFKKYQIKNVNEIFDFIKIVEKYEC